MKCDVLIVGGGPGGSSAAHACATAGLNTVFIDRKAEIGVPVSCSGAIGSYLIPLLPFKIPKDFLTWKIEELEFFVDDVSLSRKGGPWTSFAIDRTSFDVWLAERAKQAGAELLLETELKDLTIDEDRKAAKAVIAREGMIEEIEFEVLIGADGTNSTVLENLGKRKRDARIGRAVVYEFSGVDLSSPHSDQLYFGDFAPGGYAHIFPISEDRANVGVGTIIEDADINACFEEFLNIPRVNAQLSHAKIVREKSGIVPFEPLSDRRQYGNILLAGDAASQNLKPLVEGFLPSIICGNIAGETAVAHLKRGEPLESYQKNIDRKLGAVFKESDMLINVLEEISDLNTDVAHVLTAGLCCNILSIKDVEGLKEAKYEDVRKELIAWKNSKIKQVMLDFYEGFAVLYFHVSSWINSKIYK
jgi:digeranylgeranylglycerophospholipid reductase